jgi:hypothetical protein
VISVVGYTSHETQHSLYSDYARVARSGVQIPLGARDLAFIQLGLGLNQPPYSVGTGDLS